MFNIEYRQVKDAERLVNHLVGRLIFLGSGAYAQAYLDGQQVVKIGDARVDAGYLAFLVVLSKQVKTSKNLPVIYGATVYYDDCEAWYMVRMEKLEKPNIDLSENVSDIWSKLYERNIPRVQEPVNGFIKVLVDSAELGRQLAGELAIYNDMQWWNVLLRGNAEGRGVAVLIDPFSCAIPMPIEKIEVIKNYQPSGNFNQLELF